MSPMNALTRLFRRDGDTAVATPPEGVETPVIRVPLPPKADYQLGLEKALQAAAQRLPEGLKARRTAPNGVLTPHIYLIEAGIRPANFPSSPDSIDGAVNNALGEGAVALIHPEASEAGPDWLMSLAVTPSGDQYVPLLALHVLSRGERRKLNYTTFTARIGQELDGVDASGPIFEREFVDVDHRTSNDPHVKMTLTPLSAFRNSTRRACDVLAKLDLESDEFKTIAENATSVVTRLLERGLVPFYRAAPSVFGEE